MTGNEIIINAGIAIVALDRAIALVKAARTGVNGGGDIKYLMRTLERLANKQDEIATEITKIGVHVQDASRVKAD